VGLAHLQGDGDDDDLPTELSFKAKIKILVRKDLIPKKNS